MKTSELIDEGLDRAVAMCEGEDSIASCYYAEDGTPLYLDEAPLPEWNPSETWEQGGPIIEREKIAVTPHHSLHWCAHYQFGQTPGNFKGSYGETPLIAAMRCYVASKLGDEVEVPEELK